MCRLFLVILFGCVTFPLAAQTLVKECFSKDNTSVPERESEYCIIGKKVALSTAYHLDTNPIFVDTVKAFYTASKQLKFVKVYDMDGKIQGSSIEYFPNGRIKSRGKYKDNSEAGYWTLYYPDGNVHAIIEHIIIPESTNRAKYNDVLVHHYRDSTGEVRVDKGFGFCDCFFEKGHRQTGKFVKGVKDSIWSGYANDTLKYSETYRNGELLDGISYDNGITYEYIAGGARCADRWDGDGIYVCGKETSLSGQWKKG